MCISILSIYEKTYKDDPAFCKFQCQLMHSPIAKMLESLKPGMTTPEVVHCGDGHFHWTVARLGPYIGDYPKQMVLAPYSSQAQPPAQMIQIVQPSVAPIPTTPPASQAPPTPIPPSSLQAQPPVQMTYITPSSI